MHYPIMVTDRRPSSAQLFGTVLVAVLVAMLIAGIAVMAMRGHVKRSHHHYAHRTPYGQTTPEVKAVGLKDGSLEDSIREHNASLTAARGHLDQATQGLGQAQREVENARRKLQALAAAFEQTAGMAGELGQWQQAADQARAAQEAAETRASRCERELAAAEERLAHFEAERGSLREEYEAALEAQRQRIAQLEALVAELRAMLPATRIAMRIRVTEEGPDGEERVLSSGLVENGIGGRLQEDDDLNVEIVAAGAELASLSVERARNADVADLNRMLGSRADYVLVGEVNTVYSSRMSRFYFYQTTYDLVLRDLSTGETVTAIAGGGNNTRGQGGATTQAASNSRDFAIRAIAEELIDHLGDE